MITKCCNWNSSIHSRLALFLRAFILFILPVSLSSQDVPASEESSSFEEGNSFLSVDGMENWSQELDVSDLPPGKYNYIIEGTDKAGNKTLSEAINVFVDPESDKPVVGISNPEEGMTVSGKLNIIGTAVDDDEVSLVEIKINDGAYFPAQGTEFWSYYQDTASFDDGPCLLTVRSTDVNGVLGDEKSIEFILDHSIPVNLILSHENGDLVNGKIHLEGQSVDGNGIKKIEMSLDGENYEEISWKKARKEPVGTFDLSLDTRDLEDGAQVIWFKSTDESGSEGISPFLLFVDNNPPDLNILYPGESDPVDGRFTVVGTAFDDIGLASLTYRIGKDDPVAIPLNPGDPYWSAPVELIGSKKGEIHFTLTDQTGNEAEARLQIEFDLERDRPVIEILSPGSEDKEFIPVFSGFVKDDDGPVEISYAIDGEEQTPLNAFYSFSVPLEGLAPGVHKLDYYGTDSFGAQSEPDKLSFTLVGEAPHVALDEYVPLEGEVTLPFEQALEIEPETWKSVSGSVSFPNGAGSVSFSLDGGEVRKASLKSGPDGEKIFSLPLKDVPPGFHRWTVTSLDKAGMTGEEDFYFVITGGRGTRIHYADGRFGSSGSLADSYLAMENRDSVTFYWERGDNPRSAKISGDAPFLDVTVKGNRVLLESSGPGVAENLTIEVLSEQGNETVLGPYTVVVDGEAPVVLYSMEDDSIYGDAGMTLAGTVKDDSALEEMVYSLNGGPEEPVEINDGSYSLALPLSGAGDGNCVLTLTARDRRGRSTEKKYLFRKRSEAPVIKQLAPLETSGANGVVTFIGHIEEDELLSSVEYAADGLNFVPLETSPFLKVMVDLTPPADETAAEETVAGDDVSEKVPEGEDDTADSTVGEPAPPVIRLTDLAGNVSLYNPKVLIDSQGDKPVVMIQIPRDGSLVQSDFSVSGMAFDDDELASLQYRIDGKEPKEQAGVNSFEIPLALSDLEENEHYLEVRGIDANGIIGDWSGLSFHVSHNEPSSHMELPVIGESVRGVVQLKGLTEDVNGVEKVYISFDNGISYDLMEREDISEPDSEGAAEPDREEAAEDNRGAETSRGEVYKWNYTFNTNQLKDGNHSLLIKGVDRYGVTGLYTSLLTVDNTLPSLEILEPREGMEFTGLVDMEGYFDDNDELARASVEVQSLAKPEDKFIEELPLDRLLRGSLDLSGLPSGWINLRFTLEDKTGNLIHMSRNVRKVDELAERRITILTPSDGSAANGDVLVQGMVENVDSVKSLSLRLDGSVYCEPEYKGSGFFSFSLDGEKVSEGKHEVRAVLVTDKGEPLESDSSSFEYGKTGPWVVLDNYAAGDYATDRPWLTGRAGYDYIAPQLEGKELKEFEKSRAVEKVELSLDNGKTFYPVSGREEWKYRLETQELDNGELWIIVRARFRDGNTAWAKTVLIVDDTPPRVDLLSPEEGARFNDLALFAGSAEDENGLESVKGSLREGDKNHYQVPAFIQGLFLDFHFLGSTYYEGGVGLTFFDDNVKLQVLAGSAPEGRFNGTIAGLKLLANVASLPWEYFLGYDFGGFSSSLAVGTTFQYFTMDASPSANTNGTVLGAMLAQAELVKFEKPDWNMFSSFSLYMEMQFWVISSDVNAGIEPRLAFGLRTNVF